MFQAAPVSGYLTSEFTRMEEPGRACWGPGLSVVSLTPVITLSLKLAPSSGRLGKQHATDSLFADSVFANSPTAEFTCVVIWGHAQDGEKLGLPSRSIPS